MESHLSRTIQYLSTLYNKFTYMRQQRTCQANNILLSLKELKKNHRAHFFKKIFQDFLLLFFLNSISQFFFFHSNPQLFYLF